MAGPFASCVATVITLTLFSQSPRKSLRDKTSPDTLPTKNCANSQQLDAGMPRSVRQCTQPGNGRRDVLSTNRNEYHIDNTVVYAGLHPLDEYKLVLLRCYMLSVRKRLNFPDSTTK